MNKPLLESLFFKIYRSDGDIANLSASGAPAVQNILTQIQSGKIFTQPSLVLADVNVLMVYPCSEIVRIDLQIDTDAEIFRHFDFIKDGGQKREITLAQWETQTQALMESDLSRRDILSAQNNIVTTFGQIQLRNGQSICMEYRYEANLPAIQDQRRFFQVLFSLSGFPFTPLAGGISILNPAQIIGCLFHPGGEPPANAWMARSIGTLPNP